MRYSISPLLFDSVLFTNPVQNVANFRLPPSYLQEKLPLIGLNDGLASSYHHQ